MGRKNPCARGLLKVEERLEVCEWYKSCAVFSLGVYIDIKVSVQ